MLKLFAVFITQYKYQLCYIRPCQIGILLSNNLSLTNLGTFSQKHTNQKGKHKYFTIKTMHFLYIKWEKHHHNMKQWSELFMK